MELKLELAGQSYSTRSLTAAAQACVNLYAETIETPGGSGKGTRVLRSTPGFHLLVNQNAHAGSVRGLWSGGGRCFVVVGQWFYEISAAGATISSADLGSSDANPVQMFGNGNQLGIVNNGQFYIHNGVSPVKARFQLNGVVTVAGGVNLTWVSGDKFPVYAPGTADPLPTAIYVNSQARTVTFLSATTATLGSAYGGAAGTCYLLFSGAVAWATGDVFTSDLVGRPIVVNGVSYTVESVLSSYVLQLANPLDTVFANPGGPYAFTSVQPAVSYSTAGGDLVTAVTGAFLDLKYYVQRPSGGTPDLGRQVNHSAENDGTNFSGLDFFTKESYPDYLQSIYADREQLYLFGTESGEVWQNDANTGLPTRIQGAAAREGNLARYAVASIQERIYFIGGSPVGGPVAYRLDGFTPTRISTHAIEEAWAVSGNLIGSAVSWTYLEDGHYFWIICFATGSSWAYDATEKFWHERASWTGSALTTYKPWYHTFIPEWTSLTLNGAHIIGDHASAKIWVQDASFSDEDGSDVNRVRDLPYLYAGANKRVYVGRVDLGMDTGEIASGAEPTINLQWSDDNGTTVTTPEACGFGIHGQYGRRVYWIAQGSAEVSRIPRITYTGQQKITLIDLEAEVDYGTT